MPQNRRVSKRKKFVKDGIFYAELNDFLAKELAEAGYAGCEVRVTPMKTEVIIRATKTQMVVGPKGRTIRELTALVQKRFQFKPKQLELYAEKVRNKGLSALAQAESVRFRLFEGLNVRRACYSVLRFIMDSEAKGCEVVVSGKLRGQRAKSMKFREGYMIHAGDATNYYIDEAVKHVHLRQGVLGIKVKIMLPHGEEKGGAAQELPDIIKIHEPKQLEHDTGGIPVQMGDIYAAQSDPYASNVPIYEQTQQLPSDQQFDGYQQQDASGVGAGAGAGAGAQFQENQQFDANDDTYNQQSGAGGFDDYGNQQQFQQGFDQSTGGGYQDMPQY